MGNAIRFWKWLGIVLVIIIIFADVVYALSFNAGIIFPASILVTGVFLVSGFILFRAGNRRQHEYIKELVQNEQTLQQRERYLAALNKAGSLLLKAGREVPCKEFINAIGPAYDASRTYLFFNHRDNDGKLRMSQVAEWCAEGIKPEIDNPSLQNLPYKENFSRWQKILSRGDIISGRVVDFPAAERDMLEPQGILYILIVPLFIDNDFIGFIGFDNCVDDQEWGLAEHKYLATAANLLSQALKRSRAEESLRQENSRFVTVMDSLDIVILAVDIQSYELIFLNKLGKEILGDNIGRPCWKVLQKGQTGPCDFCTNHRLLDNDGRPSSPYTRESGNNITGRWYQCHEQAIVWPDGRLVRLQIATDITQIKQAAIEKSALQEKLIRSQKMEAIGLMAGGVAHDLNNILSGIVGYPDLLLMQLPEESKLRRPIEEIQKSGHRAAEVVADLLTVARGVAAGRETCSLNTLIAEYMNSPECRNCKLLYPNVIYTLRLEPDLLNISCSSVHIKKCIMNLMINAAEAISGDGSIIISTENRYVDKPISENCYMEKGEYAVLSFKDTGSGISKEDINCIFEPFYSKKVLGRSGTGLGLTVVWNTVQDHGGGVTVESGDKGTNFTLYFPATREALNKQIKSIRPDELMGHGDKILVIDDEALQQDIATKMLTALGYQVDSVSSGEEAIEYLEKNSVDLLVLDMIMDPGIGGLETYEQVIDLHPGQKAIIASGFSENKDVKSIQKIGAGQFVKKPYTINRIGVAVRQALYE
ncbi:MAG: response regulator [Deltaproteobacteria bacterium]|nr:response regulator [Deltaproteobacteria bacterium]